MTLISKALIVASLISVASLPALADTDFSFSYNNGVDSASGVVDASLISPGEYLIKSLTGTADGFTISTLLAPNAYAGNDNLLYFPSLSGTNNVLSYNGVSFLLTNGTDVNVYWVNTSSGGVPDYAVDTNNNDSETPTLLALSVPAPTPEPDSILLLGTGLLGLAGVARRRFAR